MGLGLWSLVIAGLIIVAPGCGKRGPPLPPLRPAPAAVGDLSVTRRADSVTVRFTPPAANQDGSEPLLLDHIDIYAVTLAADAAAPADVALRVETHRVARLAPAEPAVAMAFTDAVPASASIRYYQVVPYANRTRAGAASPIVSVPLEATPEPPGDAAATYDEQTLTLTWTAVTSAPAYLVYRVGDASPNDTPLHAARLTTTKFEQPVAFGKRACFVVRSVLGTAPVAVESGPSAEACVTPADTFPPPAPSGLVALASPGSINLSWDAVTAADLAGYIVLRGDGSGDRLQPLMTSPVTGTSFNDDTAKAGVRYFYAVVAVDKAVPANRSNESNRVEETGR